MVSLDDDSTRRGGNFFEERKEDDDFLTDSTTVSLVVNSDSKAMKINTTWFIALEILILVCVWASCFVLPDVCPKDQCHQTAFSLILYIVGGVWLIQFALDRLYRREHYRNRLCGYLNFYRRTRNIRRLPLLLASIGTTGLLIVSQIIENACPHSKSCGPLHRDAYLQIIVSVLSALQILILGIYLLRTVSFNRSGASPDVTQEEMSTSFLQTNSWSSDIGFRDENMLDQVLEKQADMIRYLKHHNEQLSKRVLSLSEENQTLRR